MADEGPGRGSSISSSSGSNSSSSNSSCGSNNSSTSSGQMLACRLVGGSRPGRSTENAYPPIFMTAHRVRGWPVIPMQLAALRLTVSHERQPLNHRESVCAVLLESVLAR